MAQTDPKPEATPIPTDPFSLGERLGRIEGKIGALMWAGGIIAAFITGVGIATYSELRTDTRELRNKLANVELLLGQTNLKLDLQSQLTSSDTDGQGQ